MRPKLVWKQPDTNVWYAYSGDLMIGMVCITMNHTIHWKIDAVSTKWITKGYDRDASSVGNAKRALQRSWSIWCKLAGFV